MEKKLYDARGTDFGPGGLADLLSGPRAQGLLGPFFFGEPFPVERRYGGIPVIDSGAIRFEDCIRAAGVRPREARFDVSTVPYSVRDLALIADFPVEDLINSDAPWKLKRATALYLVDVLETVSEKRAVDAVSSASNVNTVYTCKSAWTLGGNPVVAINAALDQVQATAGFRPNRLGLGVEAARAIWGNSNLLTATNGAPTLSKLAEIFRVSTIAIGESFVNSAGEGLGLSPRFWWRDLVVAIVAPERDEALYAPRWGARPTWQSAARWNAETYTYDAKDKTEGVGVSAAFDYAVVDPRLGVVVTGTGSSQAGGI